MALDRDLGHDVTWKRPSYLSQCVAVCRGLVSTRPHQGSLGVSGLSVIAWHSNARAMTDSDRSRPGDPCPVVRMTVQACSIS